MEKKTQSLMLWTLLCFSTSYGLEATLKSLVVTSDIKVHYSRTIVSAKYYNDKNSTATANFFVILPDRAYVSNFSMEMNGKVSVGVVKEKEVAKKIFQGAIEREESAGHVSVRHRFSNKFNMSVNIEPNKNVVFNLTYEELLKRTNGCYKQRIFLGNGEIIDNILVEVFITESQNIEIIDLKPNDISAYNFMDNKHVHITFAPSKREQEILMAKGYDGEFVIEYDVDRTKANVIYTLDGYFVHFFMPDKEETWAKNVVFMIDVSGSMDGIKMQQTKSAMDKILQLLDPDRDAFLLGTFSSTVQWQSPMSVEQARDFIKNLETSGLTDINKALLESLGMFRLLHNRHYKRADMLFFLSDGEPTEGVTDKEIIRYNVKQKNRRNVMIFTLAFGNNCDLDFFKALASDNNGMGRKIYIDRDSDHQIETMFKEIANLTLKDFMVTYLNSSIYNKYLTQTTFPKIFKGSEIAIAGRIKDNFRNQNILTQTTGESAQENFLKIESIEIEDLLPIIQPKYPNLTRFELLPNITMKTWAYLTLKKMFKDNGPREDINALAIKYGFVTPYTSMVVTKDQLQTDVFEERNNKYDYPSIVRSTTPPPTTTTPPPTTTTPPPTTTTPPPRRSNRFEYITAQHSIATHVRKGAFLNTYIINTNAVVKPFQCDVNLCVSETRSCLNTTKVLLLRDERADVEIFGYSLNNNSCTDFNKLTIRTRGKDIQVTPSFFSTDQKKIDVSNRDHINLKFKNFLQLIIFFERDQQTSMLRLHFIVNDYLQYAIGLYGNYMKRFDCYIQSSGSMTLSHMNRKFQLTYFLSASHEYTPCYNLMN